MKSGVFGVQWKRMDRAQNPFTPGARSLLGVMLRFCLRSRVWPSMLYVGGGMLLLTLLSNQDAFWVW